MHDLAKLFLAKKFRIKIEKDVYSTAIHLFKSIVEDKELKDLLDVGYKEFCEIAFLLEIGKRERTKAQYYTDSEYIKDIFVNKFIIKLKKRI